MLIGLVSDTHGYFHPRLADALVGCDLILHAGDIGSSAVLDALEALAPVRAVSGNIDDAAMRARVPVHQRFEVDGLHVWMTHIAGRPGRWTPEVGRALREDPPDLFVCGHSHILQVERVAALGGMLFVNPGAAGQQGFHEVKTCVRLAVEGGRFVRADVAHLDE